MIVWYGRNVPIRDTYISSWRKREVRLQESREAATALQSAARPAHETRANTGLGPIIHQAICVGNCLHKNAGA